MRLGDGPLGLLLAGRPVGDGPLPRRARPRGRRPGHDRDDGHDAVGHRRAGGGLRGVTDALARAAPPRHQSWTVPSARRL
ncbi:conserved hypothetical protein [Frigoribacterium sp. 9N]|nr:conserved hypothetical protein [Frigoribacterium sp. 9N]